MNYKIKKVEYKDLEDYIRVNTKAWQESYKGIISDDFLKKIAVEIKQNIKRQQDDFYKPESQKFSKFLLYVDNKAVGMMSIGKARLKEFSTFGELCSLYLLEEVKGKGYGKLLFQKAVDELKNMGYSDMLIGCLEKNPSNAFYRHMGAQFKTSKMRKIGELEYKENYYILKI